MYEDCDITSKQFVRDYALASEKHIEALSKSVYTVPTGPDTVEDGGLVDYVLDDEHENPGIILYTRISETGISQEGHFVEFPHEHPYINLTQVLILAQAQDWNARADIMSVLLPIEGVFRPDFDIHLLPQPDEDGFWALLHSQGILGPVLHEIIFLPKDGVFNLEHAYSIGEAEGNARHYADVPIVWQDFQLLAPEACQTFSQVSLFDIIQDSLGEGRLYDGLTKEVVPDEMLPLIKALANKSDSSGIDFVTVDKKSADIVGDIARTLAERHPDMPPEVAEAIAKEVAAEIAEKGSGIGGGIVTAQKTEDGVNVKLETITKDGKKEDSDEVRNFKDAVRKIGE